MFRARRPGRNCVLCQSRETQILCAYPWRIPASGSTHPDSSGNGNLPKNTFVLQNGDVLAISGTRAQVREHVAAGRIMVDGVAMGELEGSIMKERHELAEDGFIVVSAVVDKYLNLLSIPYIESRGFIHIEDASVFMKTFLPLLKSL